MLSTQNSVRAGARADAAARRGMFFFIGTLLLIEFLDELVFGVREAAWPLIRDDLHLTYTQVGVLLSVPPIFGNLVEPALMILADVKPRRAFVLCGGIVFTAMTLLVGLSWGFPLLLLAMMLINPASGMFVGLSQATLMDAAPARREQNMARWALFGSLGNCVGPVALGACVWAGLSWRWPFYVMFVLGATLVAAAWRLRFPAPVAEEGAQLSASFSEAMRDAFRALRRREVVRWLVLLQLGDFTWDVLRGFLALYFVDVVGVGESRAALAVVVWTWVGLPGDFLLLPLLERLRGISYLRVSTSVVPILFPAFLLVPGFAAKVVLLGLLGFANAGWYAILKARLYAEMPGKSGAAMTLGNIFGLVGDFAPLALGAFAERFGLGAMMWLLAVGPLALLLGLLTVRTGAKSESGAMP